MIPLGRSNATEHGAGWYSQPDTGVSGPAREPHSGEPGTKGSDVIMRNVPAGGGRETDPLFLSPVASEVWPGKFLCNLCGAPKPRQELNAKGVCMSCSGTTEAAVALAATVVSSEISPRRAFDDVLTALRQQGSPSGVDLAEAIMRKAGGVESLAQWIVDDVRKLKGEDLENHQKLFHEVDYKTLKSLYQLIHKILRDRDQLVKDAPDPIQALTEDDLMTLISEGARERIMVDGEYREQVLALIDEVDPDLLEQRYLARYGIPFIRRQ